MQLLLSESQMLKLLQLFVLLEPLISGIVTPEFENIS